MAKAIKTVKECVERIGGIEMLSRCTGCSRNAVYNWIAANQFPANYKDAIGDLLIMQGGPRCTAADELFPMVQLMDVPRTRGANGRFVAPELTETEKLVQWANTPQPPYNPMDHVWRDKDGNVVPPDMQVQLTYDYVMREVHGSDWQ